jgi:hypothetical protein
VSQNEELFPNESLAALEYFTSLSGDVYFVPCVPGTKKPKLTHKERAKIEIRGQSWVNPRVSPQHSNFVSVHNFTA